MQNQTRSIHGQAIGGIVVGVITGLSVVALGLYFLLQRCRDCCTRHHHHTRGVLPGPRIPTGANIDLEDIRAYGLSNGTSASPRSISSSTTTTMWQKRQAIIEGPLYVISWPVIKIQVEKALNREDALLKLTSDIPAPSGAHIRDCPRVTKEKMFKGLLDCGFAVGHLELLHHAYAAQRGRESYVQLGEDGDILGRRKVRYFCTDGKICWSEELW